MVIFFRGGGVLCLKKSFEYMFINKGDLINMDYLTFIYAAYGPIKVIRGVNNKL